MHEKRMGIKYNSNEFLTLSSNVDIPVYSNISIPYYKKYQDPAQSLSIENLSIIQTYANLDTVRTLSCSQNDIYSNIAVFSSKPRNLSNEKPYTKLLNTILTPPVSNANIAINSEHNTKLIYENIRSYSTPCINTIPVSSSTHTYINLQYQEDIQSVFPSSSLKDEQKEDIHYSSMCSIEQKSIDNETNVFETSSNTSAIQTVKKLEVNMAPNCGDKSILYRTKIPHLITQIHPSHRQRRTLHRPKRNRRRSSTPGRLIISSNALRRRQQQQNSSMNSRTHRRVTTDDRRKCSRKSVSNELYNAIQQKPSIFDNQSLNSVYSEKEIEVIDYPIEFHGALQHHILAWYPTVKHNEEELISQVLSTSDNGESNHQDEIINKEEEEEKFLPHETFEDFLLRRPPKSSCSTSTSTSNTRSSKNKHIEPPPLIRHSSSLALGLDKNDVDFIHDILQRTHGDQRISNRITALREAYVRAAIKRNDLLKSTTIAQNKKPKSKPMKSSFLTSKVHDELERYDELPIHRRAIHNYDSDDYDDDDDDDDTYSINDDYRFRHRTLPATPSTATRIISFIITLKRQLQKSFQDFRTRILIETMAMSPNPVPRHRHTLHNPSGLSHRHVSRPKTSHDMVRHNNNNNHHQQSNKHLHRTHSNTSQLNLQQQHIHDLPSSERHLPRRPQTSRSTPRQQRTQRKDRP
ncbi:unnamed protein product [Adineta steineri]|uniref:Uncharacterized protein n=1 Tax=Adineta steineri TaxID=433720 RepID=A0A818KTL9_9BILA|nr:unnamed protein product [Adineta steineri]CAF3566095.1 unnamed protein product [Adineta steineri]